MFLLVITIMVTEYETDKWAGHEQKLINEYIKNLGNTAYLLYASGLYYIELEPGSGPLPVNGDTVYFKYKASFTGCVQFSKNTAYTTPVRYVPGSMVGMNLKCVVEGLRNMRAGRRSGFLTPSNLAYGFEGYWNILAGYTAIVWTIEPESIKPQEGNSS